MPGLAARNERTAAALRASVTLVMQALVAFVTLAMITALAFVIMRISTAGLTSDAKLRGPTVPTSQRRAGRRDKPQTRAGANCGRRDAREFRSRICQRLGPRRLVRVVRCRPPSARRGLPATCHEGLGLMPGRDTHAARHGTHHRNRHEAREQPFRMLFESASSSGRR